MQCACPLHDFAWWVLINVVWFLILKGTFDFDFWFYKTYNEGLKIIFWIYKTSSFANFPKIWSLVDVKRCFNSIYIAPNFFLTTYINTTHTCEEWNIDVGKNWGKNVIKENKILASNETSHLTHYVLLIWKGGGLFLWEMGMHFKKKPRCI
jgi:hypothetical protein